MRKDKYVEVWGPTWEMRTEPDNSWTLVCQWKSDGSTDPDLQFIALERLMRHVRSVGRIKVVRDPRSRRKEAKDGEAPSE
jgi:hypothetical protein